MGLEGCVSVIFALFLVVSVATAQILDVKKYGAKADGKTDMTQTLLSVWKEACASTSPTQVFIPKGSYMLGAVRLAGPCKAPIELRVEGTLLAPVQLSGDGWVTFAYITGFTLSGTGSFDGQGEEAWKEDGCDKKSKSNCKMQPSNIRFDYITDGLVRDVKSIDSKNFHINVLGCKNFTFQSFTVQAPESSINTDGIHIGRSSGINITDTNIGTGDDCISFGDGSQQVHVTRVNCGPGHGISVGSLGKYPNESPVSGIFVKNCTLTNTDNGVRIKTWPGGPSNVATDMHFEDIIMVDVTNPVVIDQVYCPWNRCTRSTSSNVKVSDVSFKGIRGTSATPVAVSLNCSSSIPCQNVVLSDIDLTYTGPLGPTSTQCANVKPTVSGPMNPAAC